MTANIKNGPIKLVKSVCFNKPLQVPDMWWTHCLNQTMPIDYLHCIESSFSDETSKTRGLCRWYIKIALKLLHHCLLFIKKYSFKPKWSVLRIELWSNHGPSRASEHDSEWCMGYSLWNTAGKVSLTNMHPRETD